jgi:hypothetical protein
MNASTRLPITFRGGQVKILLLTKMNWNSANFDGLFLITLTFARTVGEILREVPANAVPESKYSYYM